MHKLLARQIKRALGVSDERLAAVLDELDSLTQREGLSAEAANLLSGLGTFFRRVDESYVQSDRDLDLKTRSLELSSVELSSANDRLREDLASRIRAMETLRATAREMMRSIGSGQTLEHDENLESLSAVMLDLVHQHEESKRRLQAALTDLAYQKFALDQHAIVSITDLQGLIVYANDKFCEISGYTRDELIGQNHRIVNSGTHDAAFFANLWRTITSGNVWHGEVCNRTKAGSTYWVDATVVPLRNEAGEISMFIAIRTDISENKRIAAELLKAKDAAEAGSKAKTEFLTTMSHEIRTPMNGVIGMTDLLLGTALDSQQREYAQTVKSSSDALMCIINDILDFSTMESGRLKLNRQVFNLHECILSVQEMLRPQAQEKGLRMTCTMAANIPRQAVGDAGRLRQLLLNIVGNAVKFTPEGEVALEVECESSAATELRLRCVVRDTGIGIPSHKLTTIFDAFSQEDSSTTRQFGGTGLGLALCARLAQGMGGRIWVESTIGKGSTFHFEVLLQSVPPVQEPPPGQACGAPAAVHLTAPIRVLLVEDNLINQKLALTLLKRWGHQVAVAENGQLALDALDKQSFDVVLMDMMMPVMDGLEATRQIRARETGWHIPIIGVTANTRDEDRALCFEAGMDDYTAKPIKPKELESKISFWVERTKRADTTAST